MSAPMPLRCGWSTGLAETTADLDLKRPEGKELAIRIITAPGRNAGLCVTNYPVAGFLAYERLRKLRNELSSMRIMGWPDGRPAVDYAVNAAVGVPAMTGPVNDPPPPVNHVLPAWDLLAGAYAAFSLVLAERARRIDQGREIQTESTMTCNMPKPKRVYPELVVHGHLTAVPNRAPAIRWRDCRRGTSGDLVP
jgi:crotonobetainyl-CoA:carnitine CoA-transferase CaiB-like acyl-CoA transferase